MITGVGLVCVWVLDYDEAKDFYVNKLGLTLMMDEPMEDGAGRWLLVHSEQQPNTPIMLVVPGPPLMDPKTTGKISELISTGFLGPGALATDDCWGTYKELLGRGVEFTEEPSERFYGIDAGFRDPFGNAWRLTQPVAFQPKPVPRPS
jgi:catechol 2,3-dioxygenase-like lactoylglutathione lyase family enzyme